MKGHEEIEQILASYRDATPEERARADAHMRGCAACAARFAAYARADAALGALPLPPLPARLAQPLPVVLRRAAAEPAGRSRPRRGLGQVLAPVAVVLCLIAALSVIMWSVNAGHTPATTTPTLTSTLTPTTISARETEPAARYLVGRMARSGGIGSAPTPAPEPAPTAGHSSVLLVGFDPRARITN